MPVGAVRERPALRVFCLADVCRRRDEAVRDVPLHRLSSFAARSDADWPRSPLQHCAASLGVEFGREREGTRVCEPAQRGDEAGGHCESAGSLDAR